MNKYYKIAIVGSFFSLWITSFLAEKQQLILGFFLILTFGILHGANDIVLIENINKTTKRTSNISHIANYVLFVLFGLLAFYQIPSIALLFFVVVSGYHFGEQQWQFIKNDVSIAYKATLQTVYGIFILVLLFACNKNEVQNIIYEITNHLIVINLFENTLKVFAFIMLLHFVYLYVALKNKRNQLVLEFFYLLVFAVIFSSTSLIWGFAIYFIIWHSIPSIIDQTKFIYNDYSFQSILLYVKSGLLYWILSLVGIVIFYYIFGDRKIFTALFFSFLAAITFPHVYVIIKMFYRKNTNSKIYQQ
jgi:beta-carotene 15,15'-dioxygenase